MPIVEVVHRGSLPHRPKEELRKMLPEIVAKALHVDRSPRANLTPEEISVRFSEAGQYDVLRRDLEITIFAFGYPERVSREDVIQEELHNAINALLCGCHSFFVIVFYGTGFFIDGGGS